MKTRSLRSLVLAVCLVALQSSRSFSSETQSWDAVRSQQPQGLDLTLSLPKDHFFEGEVIPATLTFSNRSKDTYSIWRGNYDRSGRLLDITFHGKDENGQLASDPLKAYLSKMFICGGLGSYEDIGTWSITMDANQWLRFEHPGTWELWAWTSRIYRGDPSADKGNSINLVSNKIRITIEPRTEDSEKAALAAAQSDIAEGGDRAAMGMSILRYLDTPESRADLIPFLAAGDWTRINAELGLAADADPKKVAAEILDAVKTGKARLTLDLVLFYTALKTHDLQGGLPGNMLITDYRSTTEIYDPGVPEARQEILAAARQAPGNNRESALARIATVVWLLDPQHEDLRAEAARHQLAIEPDLEAYIVEGSPSNRGKDFLPMIRKAASAPEYNWKALEELAALAPDEARPMIVEDMSRPISLYIPPHYYYTVLREPWLSLPKAPIPELTPILKAKLKPGDTNDHKDRMYSIWFPVVDRYGTPDLLPDVLAIYNTNAGNQECAVECSTLRFWIRCDPKAGLAALANTLHSRDRTHCYKNILTEVLLEQWNPSAVPLLLTGLNDPDDDVMQSAIRVLMAKGDSSCAPVVVNALERISEGPGPDGSEPWNVRQHQHAGLAKALLEKSDWKYSPEEKDRLERIMKNLPVVN